MRVDSPYDAQWDELKEDGFIPSNAKSALHDARNGILLCRNHGIDFNEHCFYIRWEPMVYF
jgi:hypothetical protein